MPIESAQMIGFLVCFFFLFLKKKSNIFEVVLNALLSQPWHKAQETDPSAQ